MHRFHRLSTHLKKRYGEKVFKVSLRGGFTCPNRDGTSGEGGCTFCAGEALEPVGYRQEQPIDTQLALGIDYVRRRHKARRVIAYFQDYSATYATADTLQALYAPALERPEVVGLAIGTRPDCLAPDVLELLATLTQTKPVWVELGLQLANDDVLRSLRRGHDLRAFTEGLQSLAALGIPVCVHVIIGLPGVTQPMECETAKFVASQAIWGLKLHAFHVLAGTTMADQLQRGILGPMLDRHAYAERVVQFLEHTPPEMVIHRVTGEAPPKITLAPAWTVNKMASYDAVLDAFERLDSWQGKALGAQRPGIE